MKTNPFLLGFLSSIIGTVFASSSTKGAGVDLDHPIHHFLPSFTKNNPLWNHYRDRSTRHLQSECDNKTEALDACWEQNPVNCGDDRRLLGNSDSPRRLDEWEPSCEEYQGYSCDLQFFLPNCPCIEEFNRELECYAQEFGLECAIGSDPDVCDGCREELVSFAGCLDANTVDCEDNSDFSERLLGRSDTHHDVSRRLQDSCVDYQRESCNAQDNFPKCPCIEKFNSLLECDAEEFSGLECTLDSDPDVCSSDFEDSCDNKTEALDACLQQNPVNCGHDRRLLGNSDNDWEPSCEDYQGYSCDAQDVFPYCPCIEEYNIALECEAKEEFGLECTLDSDPDVCSSDFEDSCDNKSEALDACWEQNPVNCGDDRRLLGNSDSPRRLDQWEPSCEDYQGYSCDAQDVFPYCPCIEEYNSFLECDAEELFGLECTLNSDPDVCSSDFEDLCDNESEALDACWEQNLDDCGDDRRLLGNSDSPRRLDQWEPSCEDYQFYSCGHHFYLPNCPCIEEYNSLLECDAEEIYGLECTLDSDPDVCSSDFEDSCDNEYEALDACWEQNLVNCGYDRRLLGNSDSPRRLDEWEPSCEGLQSESCFEQIALPNCPCIEEYNIALECEAKELFGLECTLDSDPDVCDGCREEQVSFLGCLDANTVDCEDNSDFSERLLGRSATHHDVSRRLQDSCVDYQRESCNEQDNFPKCPCIEEYNSLLECDAEEFYGLECTIDSDSCSAGSPTIKSTKTKAPSMTKMAKSTKTPKSIKLTKAPGTTKMAKSAKNNK